MWNWDLKLIEKKIMSNMKDNFVKEIDKECKIWV